MTRFWISAPSYGGVAVRAVPAGRAGLDRHAVADLHPGDRLAHGDDLAGRFVAEDDRPVDDPVADAPDAVVGGVRTADADGAHAHAHLARPRFAQRHLLHLDAPEFGHHSSQVRHVHLRVTAESPSFSR